MPSVMRRLKAVAQSAQAPADANERAIVAETGLPVVLEVAPDLVRAGVAAELQTYLYADDFPQIAVAFDRLFAKKAFCDNGFRTYRVVEDLLLARISATDPTNSGPFKTWWQRDPTEPVAAAMVTRVMFVDCEGQFEALVGENYERHWQPYRHNACLEARKVLSRVPIAKRDHWLWRKADAHVAYQEWDAGIEPWSNQEDTFAALQALDPYEFGIYDTRATETLERRSALDAVIMVLAADAADRTAARFGQTLFARVYDCAIRRGYFDEYADRDRAMVGFKDWYRRFPTQSLANCYAAHAHRLQRTTVLAKLFREDLTEIQPEHWLHPRQPLEAWRSISRC
jgi:hypothetical protein